MGSQITTSVIPSTLSPIVDMEKYSFRFDKDAESLNVCQRPSQLRDKEISRSLPLVVATGDSEGRPEDAVGEPVEALGLGVDPRLEHLVGEQFTFVTQRVALVGDDQRGRQPREVGRIEGQPRVCDVLRAPSTPAARKPVNSCCLSASTMNMNDTSPANLVVRPRPHPE